MKNKIIINSDFNNDDNNNIKDIMDIYFRTHLRKIKVR